MSCSLLGGREHQITHANVEMVFNTRKIKQLRLGKST